jgi:hypothetical protein
MNAYNIGLVGFLLLLIKIVIHCWLLYKTGRFKWISTDFSRLQFAIPVYFDVPKEIREFKIIANILYAISILCFLIFLIFKV